MLKITQVWSDLTCQAGVGPMEAMPATLLQGLLGRHCVGHNVIFLIHSIYTLIQYGHCMAFEDLDTLFFHPCALDQQCWKAIL